MPRLKLIHLLVALAATIFSAASLHGADFRPDLASKRSASSNYSDLDSLKRSMKERGLHRIEGIWHVTDGATVAIERYTDPDRPEGTNTLYRMVVIESPDRSLRRGTILGYAAPTADPHKYDARLFTRTTGAGALLTLTNEGTARYTLTLTNDDSRMEFQHHRHGLRIDVRKTLPLLLRTTLRYESGRDRNVPVGCIRIFPTPSLPEHPIYL